MCVKKKKTIDEFFGGKLKNNKPQVFSRGGGLTGSV